MKFVFERGMRMNFELLNTELTVSKILHEISFDEDNIPDYFSSVTPMFSAEAEATFECELRPESAKIFGLDLANGRDVTASVVFRSPHERQIRRHRKKRINKKWNKKFGPKYRVMIERRCIENVQFSQTGPELLIVGERSKMVTPYDALYI